MNLKEFRQLGGKTKWEKMTSDQKKKHIAKMVKGRKKQAKNKAILGK